MIIAKVLSTHRKGNGIIRKLLQYNIYTTNNRLRIILIVYWLGCLHGWSTRNVVAFLTFVLQEVASLWNLIIIIIEVVETKSLPVIFSCVLMINEWKKYLKFPEVLASVITFYLVETWKLINTMYLYMLI